MGLSHSHDMPLKQDIVDELQAAEVALTALLLLKEERAGFSALPFCLIQERLSKKSCG